MRLSLLCEKTGALAIVEPSLTAGRQAGSLAGRRSGRSLGRWICCKVRKFKFCIRYLSIITSLLHASPRVSPRVVRVEGAKIYRGKVRFHVTGRDFSTWRLVAFHDTWHFHETTHVAFPRNESWNFHETSYRGISHGIFTRPVVVALKSQWLVKAFTIRNLFTIELF